MRKLILYIAASLNGKIARADGSVDWLEQLPNPEQTDYGYARFLDDIDTTIMGRKTFDQLLGWDIPFPYSGKKNFVFTRSQDLPQNPYAKYITSHHADFVRELKSQAGKDIWLIGGGQVNALLWNEGLIDEIRLFIMPVVLSEGIDLFEGLPVEGGLSLVHSQVYSSGVVGLTYQKID